MFLSQTLDKDGHFPRLIDGGYLSWIFGTRPSFGSWSTVRFSYRDSLLLMDSRESSRREGFPAYKERRATKRKEDPKKKATRDRVMRFATMLREDPIVETIDYPGAEADDLVALFWMAGHGKEGVIAVDKDLWQVPDLLEVMVGHHEEYASDRFAKWCKKIPKYTERPVEPWQFVLHQCLFGDRSDSIPRLLPSRKVTEARELYKKTWKGGLSAGMEVFGMPFIQNLHLILVPGPFLRIDYEQLKASPVELMELVTTGEYWDSEMFDYPDRDW